MSTVVALRLELGARGHRSLSRENVGTAREGQSAFWGSSPVERNVVVTVNVCRISTGVDLLLSHTGFGNVLAEQVLELALVQARIAVLVELLEFAEERVVSCASNSTARVASLALARSAWSVVNKSAFYCLLPKTICMLGSREHGNSPKSTSATLRFSSRLSSSQLVSAAFLESSAPESHLQKSATTHERERKMRVNMMVGFRQIMLVARAKVNESQTSGPHVTDIEKTHAELVEYVPR